MKKPVEHEPVPMTWVRQGDALWDELCDRWAETDDLETKKPRRKRPPAIFSQHVAAEEGPGWFFRTSWIADIRSRQQDATDDVLGSFYRDGKPKLRRILLRSTAVQPASTPQPWLPLKPGGRSATITAMEGRFDRGAVQRHEWNTYAGTLRATAAILADDDPDRVRCLNLAEKVEAQAELSDDAFVRRAMGWIGTEGVSR
jgi:hypothetical protein